VHPSKMSKVGSYHCWRRAGVGSYFYWRRVGAGGTIVAYKRAPGVRAKWERAVSAVERPREKVRGCNGSSCKCSKRAGSRVWVKWSSFSMYCVVIISLSLNNMDSPVDVGGFAEPR
jgi:hypothetical protein